jgi:phosphatidylserine/phosphatidylglycerophosphate/cardiolipin synthase-like enzyme
VRAFALLSGVLVALVAGVGCARVAPTSGARAAVGLAAQAAPAGELALHVMPDESDAFFLRALSGARRSIKLQVYMLTHPGVIDALAAARARGVGVQVLLEEKPFNPGNPASPLPTNKAAAKKLEAAGVAVRWTDPRFRFTHAKLVTIDDGLTFISTANFTKSGLNAGGTGVREYLVEDRAPSDVAELGRMFAADWDRTPFTPSDPDLVISPTTSRRQIFDLIRAARKEVVVQVEVAGDRALDDLLAQKVREGVRVRAMLADLKALAAGGDPVYRSNLDVARAWQAAGVRVVLQDKPHLHAKAVQVDRGAFYVGSVNMTTNSMDNNREVGIVVRTPALAERLAEVLDRDHAAGGPVPTGDPAGKAPIGLLLEFPGLPL